MTYDQAKELEEPLALKIWESEACDMMIPYESAMRRWDAEKKARSQFYLRLLSNAFSHIVAMNSLGMLIEPGNPVKVTDEPAG